MTFLNAILTFGAAAFTIPLLIHLLNRSKYVTIDWGAMQFLASSVKVNSRRIQWKQLLLLLIRCMIPVLLALAMARPMIVAWRDSGQANAMSVAILLDDSLSMQANRSSAAGNTAIDGAVLDGDTKISSKFQAACGELERLLSQLPQGSSACLVLAGKPIEVLNENDPSRLIQRLRSLGERSQYAGSLDLLTGVQTAVEWLNRSPNARRHLIVASDFQKSDWDESSLTDIRTVKNLLGNQAVPIPLVLLDSIASPVPSEPGTDQPDKDVAIVAMDCMPGTLVEHGLATIAATLQNRTKLPVQVNASLMVGVDEVERQSISIGPLSSSTAKFQWTPRKVDDAEVRVVIDVNDVTPADNTLVRILPVRKPMKVLLIDGDRRNESMRSESDFLRLALTPFSLLHGQPGDLFTTRVVDANGWNSAMLLDHKVAVCCNVPDLTPQQRTDLQAFVESGGGLVFALGDRVQADRYNAWEGSAAGGLRPGSIAPRSAWTGTVHSTETPFFDLSNPTLESLSGVRFEARNEMKLDDPAAWSGMVFDDGAPWMVNVSIGKGRCVWVMSAFDDGDSNLPARPAFVPIMQKLLSFVGRIEPGWIQLEPGAIWRDTWAVASDEKQHELQVTTQWLPVATVPLANSSGSAGLNTVSSEFAVPRSAGVVRASLGDEVHRIGVDISTADRKRELNRQPLSEAEMQTLLVDASAKVANNADAWLSLVRSGWSGRELWTWFWLALVVLVLAELALQQSLSPRRKQLTNVHNESRSPPAASRGAA